MASSKLWPYHGMNATVTFAPNASCPISVAAPSASTSPAFTRCPSWTSGRWLIAVSWFVRQYFLMLVAILLREARERLVVVRSCVALGRAGVDDDLVGRDARDDAGAPRDDDGARVARHLLLEPRADERRRGLRSGTAWRCMFEPISARFASSCSRNGMSAAAIETSCSGATSM